MLADGTLIPQRSPLGLEIRFLPARSASHGGAAYVLTDSEGRMIGRQQRVTVSAGVEGGMVLVEFVLDNEHVKLTNKTVAIQDPPGGTPPPGTPPPVPPLVGLDRRRTG